MSYSSPGTQALQGAVDRMLARQGRTRDEAAIVGIPADVNPAVTGWQVSCPDYRLPRVYPPTAAGFAAATAHASKMDAEAKCGHRHSVVTAKRGAR